MDSIATHHFPVFVWEGNQKWLFNPVLKKRLVNRPEERIRLRWLEYLIHQSGLKKSRIGFETPIQLEHLKNSVRADIVVYTDELSPEIVVECKSENIPLTDKTAEQAARYNSGLNASYVVLTNGVKDFWFQKKNQSIAKSDSPLNEINELEDLQNSSDYWVKRGFYSPSSDPGIQNWCSKVLPIFWNDDLEWQKRYLNFKLSFLPLPMDHYYKVHTFDEEVKMAVGFMGAPGSESYLCAILNKSGTNSDVLTINLDWLMNRKSGAIRRFSGSEERKLSKTLIPNLLNEVNPHIIYNLPQLLMRFFV